MAWSQASTATTRHFWAPFSVTWDPSQHRQRSLHSSRSGLLGSKLPVAYLTPFLIINKISCQFLLSLRRRYASLTTGRLQQGEPSLFGSSSAQCQCGTLLFLVPIGFTLFAGRPHGSKKERRSCAILRWSLSYRGTLKVRKTTRRGGWIVFSKTFLPYVLKNCSQVQSLK